MKDLFPADFAENMDNGTTYVTVETPKDWKCPRKNCKTDFKHTHSTYPSLTP